MSHPTAHPKRVESLDLLRAFAIAIVFLSHYNIFGSETFLHSVGQYGWAGVDLFFVLSGYLIASQLLKPVTLGKLPSYRDFYLRRALRILPSYLAVLVLYLLFPNWRERDVISPLWSFLTFTMNFGLDFKHVGAFSHAWSLCVEEHFYLVLPVLVIALARPQARKWVSPLLVGVFLAGIALRLGSWLHFMRPLELAGGKNAWGVTYYKMIYYPSYNRLDGLLAGVTVALTYRFRPALWQRLTQHGNLLTAIGAALLTAACFVCERKTSLGASVYGFPLIALGFASLVIAGLSPGCVLARLRVPGASTLALLAFTFYLTHKEVIRLVHRRIGAWGWNQDGVAAFAITLGACLVVSGLLHHLIERPFLALRDRLLEPLEPPPVGASWLNPNASA